MAFTKEDIGNMALSHLGEARINNFEEKSEEAKECALWYDACRIETLEAHNWPFARVRKALVTHNEAPPDGVWGYRYQYPTQCAKVRWVVHPYSRKYKRVPYQIELAPEALDKSILTDLESAHVVYTLNLTNVSLFDVQYITAMSHLMAARMAKALNGTEKDQRLQYQLYQGLIRFAQAQAANENQEDPPEDADAILARSGGTDFTPTSTLNIWDVPGNTGG